MTKHFNGLYLIFLLVFVSCNDNGTNETKSVKDETSIQKIDKIHDVGKVTLDDIKVLLTLSGTPDQKDLLYKSGFIEISSEGYGRAKKENNTTNTVDDLKGYTETLYDNVIGEEHMISICTYDRNHYLSLRESAKKLYKFKETTPGGTEEYIDGKYEFTFNVNSYQPQSVYTIGIGVSIRK